MSGKNKNPQAKGGVAGARGGVAGNLSAGTNTAGRDISFHKRDFTPEETNFFLYRTVFLYVCFGIPGIDRLLGVTIDALLLPNGGITDMQVKKMIWVVCNFNHYLTLPEITTKEQFIQSLNYAYVTPGRQDTRDPQEIAKSIATLVVRVFVAFQMRINLGNDASVVSAPPASVVSAPPALVVAPAAQSVEVVSEELNRDMTVVLSQSEQILNVFNTVKMKEINTAVNEKIEKIKGGSTESDSTRRISDRVRLLNEALGRADAERKEKQTAAAATAEAAKREKIRVETERLQECIVSFGQSIKFIEPIPAGIHKEFPIIKFEPAQFYKLLPKVLARMISSINRRIVTTEIKPGPGTAETLNSLGLPDPGIKIPVDDEEDEEEQGGGSSSRSRRFGITKRKKNNKILRRLNSKNKKNPRNILYGGRGGVRHYVEHAQPIPQCESTIGNYHKYVNPTCYICGEPWIKGVQSSMECEHILCVIHGIEYYGLLQSVYLSDEQKKFLSILYAWAHRCCNQRKRNIAFIRKNPSQDPAARGNYFVPDDVNIRELLSDIFTLSTYLDSNRKHKFDCNKILKKVKDNKKQFVDKRTAVVTSYVTPLVACINTVFTGLFAANMVLFNAIGCLKIIAEMSIYFTAVGKKDPRLQLEFAKTATFMSEIVFPGCEQVSAGGGGRRIIHDKKTRKSLRRKIQRGGAPGDIINAINGLLAQEEYEKQMYDFKNAVDAAVEEPGGNPSSSRMLSNTLNRMFPGQQPSPSEPPSPLPQLGARLEPIVPTKMNAILFILFVLNHSRNPTILLGLFLDLKKQDIIVTEETELAHHDAEDESEPVPPVPQVDFGTNITQSFRAYQDKRQENKTVFINICSSVFTNAYTMTHIIGFLAACDMMPSFVGVVMFCASRSEFVSIKDTYLLHIITQYMRGIDIPRFRNNVEPTLILFHTNIGLFLQKLTDYVKLFAESVAAPETPLDHLVNACYHLKQISVNAKEHSYMLLHACYLFPSCFDHEDIFSQFGHCDAYGHGVLENHHFQAALGCVASAKTMCARILIDKLPVTPSKHSPDEQGVAFQLFSPFFDEEDNTILSNPYQPAPAMLTSSSKGFGSEPVTPTTGLDIQSRIQHAIQTFGTNQMDDADNFFIIIIGMSWENRTLKQNFIPPIDATRKYIFNKISTNPQEFAQSIASYLKNKRNQIDDTLVSYINNNLFRIIWDRVKPNTETVKVPEQLATVQKYKQVGNQPGRVRTNSPDKGDTSHLQIDVVDRFLKFAKMLVDRQPVPDSQDSQRQFQKNKVAFGSLIDEFNGRFKGFVPEDVTADVMINYLSSIIALLLPEQSVPSSPSSASSQSDSPPPPPQRDSEDFASEILKTYHYFKDESFEDDDINVVYKYITRLSWNNLKYNINSSRPHGVRKLEGGSSPHNTKRQHRKKQKIKSRRKNKYNTTKTRKNRNS